MTCRGITSAKADVELSVKKRRFHQSRTNCSLMTANPSGGFARVADTVNRSRAHGFSAGAPHFIGNVTMKSVLGTLPGNRLIARIRCCPDGIAIFKAAYRWRRL